MTSLLLYTNYNMLYHNYIIRFIVAFPLLTVEISHFLNLKKKIED